jgi:hypothetical protein
MDFFLPLCNWDLAVSEMCKARCAHCAHCLQDDQRWIIQKEYMLHGKRCDAYRRGSTAARGEGEEDEGNVLPLLSRINSHCLWTKKICRIWQCRLFKTARVPRSWQHVLRGRGIARICDRICREDRSLGKHPALTRTDPHAHAREYKRALPLALSEYDEENFLVNDRTIPRPHLNDIRWTALKRCAFPTIWSWLGKFYRQRIHERTLPCPHFEGRTLDPHTRCLATSKADKEKIKINERTIPRPHLDDVRWTQTGLCLCVWGGSGCW